MECTMPTAKFVPKDNEKSKEYILECLSEARRGLSFIDNINPDLCQKLKDKIFNVEKNVEMFCRKGVSK